VALRRRFCQKSCLAPQPAEFKQQTDMSGLRRSLLLQPW
jgi:hypothetical protein